MGLPNDDLDSPGTFLTVAARQREGRITLSAAEGVSGALAEDRLTRKQALASPMLRSIKKAAWRLIENGPTIKAFFAQTTSMNGVSPAVCA